MSETKTPAGSAGKYTAAPDQDEARARVTRRLIVCVVICVAVWACLYIAQATGDMSTRLARGLSSATLAAGAFYAGTWKQFMWPKEG